MLDEAEFKSALKELQRTTLKALAVALTLFVLISIIQLLIVHIVFYFFEHQNQINRTLVLLFITNSFLICFSKDSVGQKFKTLYLKLIRAKKDYKSISYILEDKQPFALYLRDFKSGRELRKYYTIDESYFSYGSNRGKIISTIFSKYIPTLFLNDINELSSLKGLLLLSTDANWFKNFSLVAKKAKYIICDFGSEFGTTENIRMEIDFISQLNKKNVILFCSEDNYSTIRNKHTAFFTMIHTFNSLSIINLDERHLRGETMTLDSSDTFYSLEINEAVRNLLKEEKNYL